MFDPTSLSEFLNTWGYAALFALLVLTGIGSPVPEDLLLLIAGYLVYTGVFSWPVAFLVCVPGVVGSDLVLYSIGRRIGRRGDPTDPGAPRGRVAGLLDRFGPTAVFVARLLPGTRVIAFITAGVRGVPVPEFLRYDVLGACVWVPLMLVTGHSVGDEVGGLDTIVSTIRGSAVWIAAVAVVLLLVWLRWPRIESKL